MLEPLHWHILEMERAALRRDKDHQVSRQNPELPADGFNIMCQYVSICVNIVSHVFLCFSCVNIYPHSDPKWSLVFTRGLEIHSVDVHGGKHPTAILGT